MIDFIPIITAYLLGAIPFGLLVARMAGVQDIRKTGSGNIGATNVWRTAGFKVAVWVFAGDIGKGVIAVLLAKYYFSQYELNLFDHDIFFVICAAAAVIGHVFPVYLKFKGGKGVNTALGTMIVLLPFESLIAVGIFLLVVLIFRYISLGSIFAACGLFAYVMIEKYMMQIDLAMIYIYLSGLLVLLILITHRQNISRLLNGTENRFSLSSKKKEEPANV